MGLAPVIIRNRFGFYHGFTMVLPWFYHCNWIISGIPMETPQDRRRQDPSHFWSSRLIEVKRRAAEPLMRAMGRGTYVQISEMHLLSSSILLQIYLPCLH